MSQVTCSSTQGSFLDQCPVTSSSLVNCTALDLKDKGLATQTDDKIVKIVQNDPFITFGKACSSIDHKSTSLATPPLAEAKIPGIPAHACAAETLQSRLGLSADDKDTLFYQAIKKGDVGVVTCLLDGGANPSILFRGISPLYTACKQGRIDIAKVLLERGVNPNQKNDCSCRADYDKDSRLHDHEELHGALPIQAAAITGNKELVQLLIEHGALFDKPDAQGRPPAHVAIRYGHEDLALFLFDKGADVQRQDATGFSLMHTAILKGQLKVVQELVKKGACVYDQYAKESKDMSTLYTAAQGDSAILDFMLKNGAREYVNAYWGFFYRPLGAAVRHDSLENVKLLVEAGADLSLDYDGQDILQMAKNQLNNKEHYYGISRDERATVRLKRESIVKYLLRATGKKEEPELPSPDHLSLSDASFLSKGFVKQTLFFIQKAMEIAGAEGAIFLLVDLKDIANKEQGWLPPANPFCDTVQVMKSHMLLDDKGHMSKDVKSIVKSCVVGEDFETRLQIPESLTQ